MNAIKIIFNEIYVLTNLPIGIMVEIAFSGTNNWKSSNHMLYKMQPTYVPT